MCVQVTKKQISIVESFKKAYPHYSNEDILEMAATPRFIPVLCKHVYCLNGISLIQLAHILTGNVEVAEEVETYA